MVKDIIYHKGGLIELRIPKGLLIFTQPEWIRALRRGKHTIRARLAKERENKRAQVHEMTEAFPKF